MRPGSPRGAGAGRPGSSSGSEQLTLRLSTAHFRVLGEFIVATWGLDGLVRLVFLPEGDLLRIAIAGAGRQSVTVALFDMLGRSEVIHTGVLPDGAAEFTHSLHSRGAGVYYLVALLGEAVLVKRVTKL